MASRVTTLAVAYSDANTVRSRLVGVAQCVRELCSAAGHSAQLPQLALPRIARFGFWHMGFRSEDDFAAAIETLHGRELGPTAGCPAGRLVLEREEQPFDGIAVRVYALLPSQAARASLTAALLPPSPSFAAGDRLLLALLAVCRPPIRDRGAPRAPLWRLWRAARRVRAAPAERVGPRRRGPNLCRRRERRGRAPVARRRTVARGGR